MLTGGVTVHKVVPPPALRPPRELSINESTRELWNRNAFVLRGGRGDSGDTSSIERIQRFGIVVNCARIELCCDLKLNFLL